MTIATAQICQYSIVCRTSHRATGRPYGPLHLIDDDVDDRLSRKARKPRLGAAEMSNDGDVAQKLAINVNNKADYLLTRLPVARGEKIGKPGVGGSKFEQLTFKNEQSLSVHSMIKILSSTF
jgi:hypothetical protein